MLLALGAAMASAIGTLIGSLINSIESYFSIVKVLMFFLYAPGILLLFPDVPLWVGKCFPTYYILNPVIEISLKGGAFTDVATDVCIGMMITTGIIILTGKLVQQPQRQIV